MKDLKHLRLYTHEPENNLGVIADARKKRRGEKAIKTGINFCRSRTGKVLGIGTLATTLVAGGYGLVKAIDDQREHNQNQREQAEQQLSEEEAFVNWCLEQGGYLELAVRQHVENREQAQEALRIINNQAEYTVEDSALLQKTLGYIPLSEAQKAEAVTTLLTIVTQPDKQIQELFKLWQGKRLTDMKYHFFPSWRDFCDDFKASNNMDLETLHRYYEKTQQELERLLAEKARGEKERDRQIALLQEYEKLEQLVQEGKGTSETKIRMKQIVRATKHYREITSRELYILGQIEQSQNYLDQWRSTENKYQDARQYYKQKGDPAFQSNPTENTHSLHVSPPHDHVVQSNTNTLSHRKFQHPQKRNTRRG